MISYTSKSVDNKISIPSVSLLTILYASSEGKRLPLISMIAKFETVIVSPILKLALSPNNLTMNCDFLFVSPLPLTDGLLYRYPSAY